MPHDKELIYIWTLPESSSTPTTLVLYCGGFRSAQVADVLQKMGYTNAISLDDGCARGTRAGLPIEKQPLLPLQP